MDGKVKFFNDRKGFGFITANDGKDYFVHQTQVPEDVRLNENDAVTFDPVDTDKGIQAQNVKLATGASSDDSSEDVSDDSVEDSEDFSDDEDSKDE